MPLDGTELFEDPSLAKLNQVERLLATERHWCKGRLRDADGRRCLVDAITTVGGRLELTRPILRAVKEVSGRRYWRIETFNDDPLTTHRDVLRVLHRTREDILEGIAASACRRPWQRKLVLALGGFLAGDPRGDAKDPAHGPRDVAPRSVDTDGPEGQLHDRSLSQDPSLAREASDAHL
ncbi:MAG: DUF6197 family protein [Stellaceae bacterium]